MKTKRLLQAISALFIAVATSAVGGTFTANYLGGGIWEQEPGAWSTTAWPRNHFYYVDSSGNHREKGPEIFWGDNQAPIFGIAQALPEAVFSVFNR